MTERNQDLRDCLTAYDCRDRLPDLAAWMSDDALKQITIWKGARFERGETYFDLDNPDRGPFAAVGTEQPPKDRTYARESDIAPEVWAQLVTWKQAISEEQGDSIATEVERSATTQP